MDERAAARAQALASLSVPLVYPADLPITARKDELVAALRAHQVVIVAGATGSGKSTQLPKICLEAGRGVAGMIGHTQPRRIAARSVAGRVAEELGVELGGIVGYKVRFAERLSEATLIKLMTDGVLLAELAGDKQLRAYDTVIVDEAHERGLNIDFVLGYLSLLLAERRDLKAVITSATIDTESFSRHFGGAPVFEVAGRVYPVEIRYRPFGGSNTPAGAAGEEPVDRVARRAGPGEGAASPIEEDGAPPDEGEAPADEVEAVCKAVAELCQEGPGDILVFLAGEAEIRDTAEAIANACPKSLEILPLYGRLSPSEQLRIFEPHELRRVVLSTNVAETSITVPGIVYVVDAGTARISRYSRRTKVQRLPIERVSQAAADQRAGRCGRLGPGICIRLYSEEDYMARRRFTEPEVLRTNLASVVLQMAAIGLGDPERFPFIDPPDRRNIKDGLELLEELGAFERSGALGRLAPGPQDTKVPGGRAARAGRTGLVRSQATRAPYSITPLGRRLARIPLDPRLGRVVLEAGRLGCLSEVLVIAAALAVQDPRARPSRDKQGAGPPQHRFDDQGSDFLAYLSLWDYLFGRRQALSSSQFRRLCKRELISYQRAREWQDVHDELVTICRRELHLSRGRRPGLPEPTGGAAEGVLPSGAGAAGELSRERRALVHQALLAGLATQVGLRQGDRRDFLAPRGARFLLWPGSVLAKKPPRWVMVAELTETGRLWGRVAAPVKPQWVERVAAHLLEWSYGEPAWDAAAGEVRVEARATLYGLPVVPSRPMALARLGPDAGELAREIFVMSALVECGWEGAPEFALHNAGLLERLAVEARKARRPAPGAGELKSFYDAKVSCEVMSAATFERWWLRLSQEERQQLWATPTDLGAAENRSGAAGFPDTWGSDANLRVNYDWEGAGITVEVPFARFAEVRAGLEWQVPGLREELVAAWLRSLPKHLRREVAPIGERARDFAATFGPADGSLVEVLARYVTHEVGVGIRPEDFDPSKVPAHLRPSVRVVGTGGELLASGKDFVEVEAELRPHLQRALAEAASSEALGWGPAGRRSARWDFGALPAVLDADCHGKLLRAFPALVDDGDAVRVAVFADEPSQRAAMAAATRRLLLLNLPGRRQLATSLEHLLDNRCRLALGALNGLGYRTARDVVEDIIAASLDEVVRRNGGPAWDESGFDRLVEAARRDVGALARAGLVAAQRIVSLLYQLQRQIADLEGRSQLSSSLEDARAHLALLGAPSFAKRFGLGGLADLERYLTALGRRLAKLPADPARDIALVRRLQSLAARVDEARPQSREELAQMLEELRVSFFAQSLGTKVPVSEARLLRAIAENS